MVAYSFQKRFVEPIVQGRKCQTIRAVGKRKHAAAGDALQLYTAMRTKHCRKILDTQCAGRGSVQMKFEAGEIVDITLGGKYLDDLDQFARADGFDDLSEMTHFWEENYGTYGLTGWTNPMVLITWASEERIDMTTATKAGPLEAAQGKQRALKKKTKTKTDVPLDLFEKRAKGHAKIAEVARELMEAKSQEASWKEDRLAAETKLAALLRKEGITGTYDAGDFYVRLRTQHEKFTGVVEPKKAVAADDED